MSVYYRGSLTEHAIVRTATSCPFLPLISRKRRQYIRTAEQHHILQQAALYCYSQLVFYWLVCIAKLLFLCVPIFIRLELIHIRLYIYVKL